MSFFKITSIKENSSKWIQRHLNISYVFVFFLFSDIATMDKKTQNLLNLFVFPLQVKILATLTSCVQIPALAS